MIVPGRLGPKLPKTSLAIDLGENGFRIAVYRYKVLIYVMQMAGVPSLLNGTQGYIYRALNRLCSTISTVFRLVTLYGFRLSMDGDSNRNKTPTRDPFVPRRVNLSLKTSKDHGFPCAHVAKHHVVQLPKS